MSRLKRSTGVNLVELIGVLLVFIGYVCFAAATLSGIGYALYLFANDVVIAKALWEGFALFLKLFFGGLGSMLVGWIFSKS